MKKNDILTPIGLLAVIAVLALGIVQGGGGIGPFIDLPSFAITIGGSLASVLITYTIQDLKQIPKVLKLSLTSNNLYKLDLVDQFKELSRTIRKDGILAIEEVVSEMEDPFMKKGLELVIDGMEYEDIKEILENEISLVEDIYERGSNIFKVWGSYAPAFGMIGTLIGLIQMLADLGNSADALGMGMSKALITTLYGTLLANGILNPIAYNLDNKCEKEVAYRDMIMCGIFSIQDGDSTRVIEEKLLTHLSDEERTIYFTRELIEGESLDAT